MRGLGRVEPKSTGRGIDPPLRTGSLRRRVVAAILALMVVVLTGLCLVINVLLMKALHNDLRQRLTDKVSAAVALDASGVSGQTLADQLSGGGVFASFESGRRRYIGREQAPDPRRPGQNGPGQNGPGQNPLPDRGQPVAIPPTRVSEANGQLIESVTLNDGVLTLSTGEVEINRTLAALRRIELLAGAATIVVTGGIGLFVVRAALRPLDRMTLLANRIRGGARGRRLRPTRPRTDLGRTASAFDGMLDALEQAESSARSAELQMRQFLADASHDLRTPLAGVIAGAESVLLSDRSRRDRETRLVELIRQAQRAARLVDNLLRLARLDGSANLPADQKFVDPEDTGRAEHADLGTRVGFAGTPGRGLLAHFVDPGRPNGLTGSDGLAHFVDPGRPNGLTGSDGLAHPAEPGRPNGLTGSDGLAHFVDPGRPNGLTGSDGLAHFVDPGRPNGLTGPTSGRTLIDLRDPARQEIDSLRLRFPAIDVKIDAVVAVPVLADPDDLQRALGNLFDNAARVTEPSGRIIAKIVAEQAWAVMVVTDSGPGVPEAQRERIFDRFVRLEDSRSTPGSGLGLPIARSIARRHGGEVRCLPTHGVPGARFELRLPLERFGGDSVGSGTRGRVLTER